MCPATAESRCLALFVPAGFIHSTTYGSTWTIEDTTFITTWELTPITTLDASQMFNRFLLILLAHSSDTDANRSDIVWRTFSYCASVSINSYLLPSRNSNSPSQKPPSRSPEPRTSCFAATSGCLPCPLGPCSSSGPERWPSAPRRGIP